MGKLTGIVGLEESHTEKLKAAGILSIEKLLAEGATTAGRKELSRRSKISEKLLLGWVRQADLFRIKGIAGNKTQLLAASGITSMRDLAKVKPDRLYVAMVDANEKKRIVERVPGIIQVQKWVETAKELSSLVKE